MAESFTTSLSTSSKLLALVVSVIAATCSLTAVAKNDSPAPLPFNQVFTQQAELDAGNAAAGGMFGYHLDLSADGNTLAVGASFAANSGGASAGNVYVFTRSGDKWQEQARLQASDASPNALFGITVALSADGNTLAVGAHFSLARAGEAYVFTRTGNVWSEQARLQASDAAPGGLFGVVALAADAETLAVGDYFADNSAEPACRERVCIYAV